MAKKKKRRGGKSMQKTAFKLIRMLALAAPGIGAAVMNADNETKLRVGVRRYTGFDWGHDGGRFGLEWILKGYTPYLATTLIHKGVEKASGIISRL